MSDQAKERTCPPGNLPVLFTPEELDIYVNKTTADAYIFHGKTIDYAIDHIAVHATEHWVIVVMRDGRVLDLGVNVQWLVRPYLFRANEISVVRTEKGESKDGVVVPLKLIEDGMEVKTMKPKGSMPHQRLARRLIRFLSRFA